MANRANIANGGTEVFDFRKPNPVKTAGQYGCKVLRIVADGDSNKVTVRPHEIADPSKEYSPIRGWVPKEIKDNSITEHFLTAFGNPQCFGDVIGKSATIEVDFNTDTETGETYANVVDFVI